MHPLCPAHGSKIFRSADFIIKYYFKIYASIFKYFIERFSCLG
ncbi:Uncharacterized protein dnm_058530 [Desulfonema magnum]|uniref:Uncharacterized protein n=1 Tax=Desulfonema magnum TaxID=45655 RepID=A0A975BQI6_9BACT|nr:Uncharacterized protein dnm_058530 [Desulfonema magnum]